MSLSHTQPAILTLEELLSYDDEHFIKNAYQVLLGRDSDSEGMSYYHNRMKTGIGKVEILAQLRNSAEGKSRQIKISGLNEAVRRHKQLKTPVLGALMRLAGLKQVGGGTRKSLNRNENEIPLNVIEMMERYGINEGDLPQSLTLETIHRLNPNEHFDDLFEALSALIMQPPIRKLRVYDAAELNANFYVRLALNHAGAGRHTEANELYRLSLLFAGTPTAHEHLGNFALDKNKYHLAAEHYKMALKLNIQSPWVYANFARALMMSGKHEEAINTIQAGICAHPSSKLLMSRLDEFIDAYWDVKDQALEFIAETQNRERLMAEYDAAATFISNTYSKIFRINSISPITVSLNTKRVLIVGITFEASPQCYRYRIEQKLEQLTYAGYEVQSVPWHDHESAMNLINFYDLIVFYRTPAFPRVLKLVEYAKSLGKITFYELDDLLFEIISVPPIETYGGLVSLAAYTSVTKDIGSHRVIASKCDYAIASTLPLLNKLAPLTQTQIGYLHRNGLDRHNQLVKATLVAKDHISIFYGSGTIAHNSDFIIEALPALSRILKEHTEVKLTIMGYLTVPEAFLSEFKSQIVQVPFIRDIEVYWAYLSASDISLAVLHDDVLTACKSELKWFEAATFSIPSVVSRTQNYLDVVNQGEDGLVVSGEHQWYEALKQLVVDPNLRRRIGAKAYERVKEEYSVSALAKNIDHIMKNAVLNHYQDVEKAQNL